MTCRFVLNSMPKSGTHLLTQVVPPLVGGRLSNVFLFEGYPSQVPDIEPILDELAPEEIAGGHLYFGPEIAASFRARGIRVASILRDPRDIVVSLVHYREQLHNPGDPKSEHLRDCLHDHGDRLRAVVLGYRHGGVDVPDIATFCRLFLPWESWPWTAAVRFEELVRPNGRSVALRRSFDELCAPAPAAERAAAIGQALAAIDPVVSPTFRAGHVGDWQAEFDQVTRDLFKVIAGDLLVEMGYERDLDW